jgi:hypothetical protein
VEVILCLRKEKVFFWYETLRILLGVSCLVDRVHGHALHYCIVCLLQTTDGIEIEGSEMVDII